MSLTDQSADPSSSSQAISEVRLAPQFVNRLCARLETAAEKSGGVCGLLFGTEYGPMVIVQAFRSFMESELAAIDFGNRSLATALQDLARAAENDAALKPLDVVGWYSFRSAAGVNDEDADLHDSLFPAGSDVALIIRRGDGAFLLFDFYTRSDRGVFSSREYRTGSARFSPAEANTAVVDVRMRERADRAKAMVASAAAGAAPGASAQIASAHERTSSGVVETSADVPTRSPVALSIVDSPKLPNQITDPIAPIRSVPVQPILVQDSVARPRISAPARPGIKPTPNSNKILWLSALGLFAVAALVTFAFLALPGLSSSNAGRAALPDYGLNLHVETQGERLLLTWNRNNPVAHAAASGVLHIDDGAQHRDVQLDAGQVENGAVLYDPNSDDVNFRLFVKGQNGKQLAENLRVLEGRHAGSQPLQVSSNSETAPPDQFRGFGPPQPVPARTDSMPQQTPRVAPPVQQPKQQVASLEPPVSSPVTAVPHSSDPSQSTSAGSVVTSQNNGPPNPPPLSAPTEIPALKADATPPKTVEQKQPETTAPVERAAVEQPAPPERKIELQRLPTPRVELKLTEPAQAPAPTADTLSFAQRYVPPKPIRQVLPNISALLPSVFNGTHRVSVIVNVDNTGHVTQVRADPQDKTSTILIEAAEYAAKQWVFAPARLDGKPVPAEHSIVFQFGQ